MAPKFSLQTVLDVRHSKVEALEIEMGKLQLAQQEKIALEETLQRLKFNLFDQLQDQMVGDMDLVLIEQLRGNIDQVEEGIQITRQVIEELGKRIEAKRRELVAARQDEETLDILKRKEQDRFAAEMRRKENNLQDDLYISRIYRMRNQSV
ncbi:hypothetical protein ADN00_17070 [Ornatilinea apprima]|uniref:Flagellar FliJ protein n=1 Tax=Ornatilinea apprima TaxID=1134406 RepID=A0A0P6XA16_9CHLR|nr:flagellar FliJ family protein [Ornatilinea apprima]KPL71406.1 hypothetical protein ADN00_17070 [Ornatilinea apprima]